MKYFVPSRLACCFLLSVIFTVVEGSAADCCPQPGLELVKEKALVLLGRQTSDGPRGREATEALESWCAEYLETAYQPVEIDPDPEITTTDTSSRARDLRRLAEAYVDEHGSFYHDERVLARIIPALDNVLDMYRDPAANEGNWYYWLLNTPGSLAPIGLLLEDSLPEPLLNKLIRTLEGKLQEMVLTGANASWEARNHIFLALLTGDEERLTRAAGRVVVDVRYGSDGGVLEDYAYLFHGRIPYAGGYGAGFAQTVAFFAYLLDGTPWQIRREKVALIENLLLEHTQWFIAGNSMDIHIRGRGYEESSSANSIAEAMLYLSRCEGPRLREIQSACRALIEGGARFSPSVASWADEIMASELRESGSSGYRYWYTAEMGAFNTEKFHVGFRQYSSRVQDYEFLTLKGGEGWNLAMGSTMIMRKDGTGDWYQRHGLAPGINMEFLNTVTSREGANPVNRTDMGIGSSGYSLNFGTSPFAGGCGMGDGGVAGFILEPPYGGITARKSLHFFPDGYWALGSGITATKEPAADAGAVRTSVLQWRSGSDSIYLHVSDDRMEESETEPKMIDQVTWLWVDGVGIVFAEPVQVWHRKSGDVVTVWLDHGTAPNAASYAFAILPEYSLPGTQMFAGHPPLRPVRIDDQLHLVESSDSGRVSAVFFKAGSHGNYSATGPLVMFHAGGEDGGLLCLQDPLHRKTGLELSFSLPQPVTWSDPEVTCLRPDQDDRIVVRVDSLLGREYRLGYGERGRTVRSRPREDLSRLYAFSIDAESTAGESVLTFTMPPGWQEEDWRISIHGNRGHHLLYLDELGDPEILSGNRIRYRWDRALPETEFDNANLNQRSGSFRAWYETSMSLAVDYFFVPEFDKDGKIREDAVYYSDRDNPRWKEMP